MTISFATVCLSLGLMPQDLPRAVLDPATITIDPMRHESATVVVKLAEDSGRSARADVDEVVTPRRIRPFFFGLEEELRGLRRRVLANTPAGVSPPADLSLYLEVATRGVEDGRALLIKLNRLAAVEIAYPKELPVQPPGDILPLTPNYTGLQGYAAPAPKGIHASALRQLTGAWGGSITVLDIEWGWWFDHEDIAALRPNSLVGPPLSRSSFNNHGTAVSGVLAGDPDQWGVTGLVPDIRLLTATNFPASGYSVARAIVVGLPKLTAGDVMLLEAQARTPLGLGPTEWNQADFDAIQNATRAGIITVEAAGNGGVNLDHAALGGLFDLKVRDSGAIIVGATAGEALVRAGFSCYGDRIDANGWGGSVTTTGYGSLFNPGGDRRQRYTRSFSGTSSASPIVTSAVVALIGAARAQLSPRDAAAFDYRRIRELLRTHGTSVPGAQKIGRRPDLLTMLRAAGLERGLRILDPAVLGRTQRMDIQPGFRGTGRDSWLLLGAPKVANVAFPLAPAPCDRWLLDPTSAKILASGNFVGGRATVSVPIPNDPRFLGARFYWQAVTLRSESRHLCLTNSSMAFGQR